MTTTAANLSKREWHDDPVIWHPELSVFTPTWKHGKNCVIHSHVWLGCQIGDSVTIEAFSFIPDWVLIGDDVFIGPRVTFTNDKRPPSYGKHWDMTFVGNRVSIGAGAVILPGVRLGHDCVIGAGAVVTKNVPAGETWVGNPAKQLCKHQ
jgi:acetyltransferase-like isoleucine patch superfamily enzyme